MTKTFKIGENLIEYNGGYIGINEDKPKRDDWFILESNGNYYLKVCSGALHADVHGRDNKRYSILFATANLNLPVAVLDIPSQEEKYKYTEEQVLKAIQLAGCIDLEYLIEKGHESLKFSEKEILQAIQAKIKSIEVEIGEYVTVKNIDYG